MIEMFLCKMVRVKVEICYNNSFRMCSIIFSL